MATIISKSPSDTLKIGAEWGRSVAPGLIVGMVGDLGAGKTQLVKGIAQGLGVTERVASPTFTLVHEYTSGRLPLYHLDLYRLDKPSEITAAGLDEYLDKPEGVTVIEWVDRWLGSDGANLRNFRLVRIALLGENQREISYEDSGS
jgi:tRNA threonylcarbamoyladenosine biosynthesis protein TsaE